MLKRAKKTYESVKTRHHPHAQSESDARSRSTRRIDFSVLQSLRDSLNVAAQAVVMEKQIIKTDAAQPSDRQMRTERRRYGPVVIEADYETVDGVESPEPSKVQFYDHDRIVEIAGRNALAVAHILAIAMARNQILD